MSDVSRESTVICDCGCRERMWECPKDHLEAYIEMKKNRIEELQDEIEKLQSIRGHVDRQYIELCKKLLTCKLRPNRTGIPTHSSFGERLDIDLRQGFPLLTTKRVFWRGVVAEVLWFLSGSTDTKVLSGKGIRIWDGNTTREALDKLGLKDYPEGEVGPCFIAGTKVLTQRGYLSIEDVDLTDQLYTHLGNWKSIVNLQERTFDGNLIGLKIRYHPRLIQTTPEHPFWARKFRIHDSYHNRLKGLPRHVVIADQPSWIPASELTREHMIGFKVETAEIIPTVNNVILNDPDMWFMLGYFVGDGWVQTEGEGSKRIVFAISDRQEWELVPRLRKILKIAACLKQREESCKKWRCSNKTWTPILESFGKYAHGKFIPDWVHKAPKNLIEHFLNGYFEADGCVVPGERSRKLTTVSADLAFSVQRLFLKLGLISSVQFQSRSCQQVIEDRIVQSRDCYFLEVYEHGKRRNNYSFIEGDYAWFVIYSQELMPKGRHRVYNFEVSDDNTYTVENLSVHNCYGFQWTSFGADFKPGIPREARGGVDQVAEAIRQIRRDPTSRRILVSAWNPVDLPKMALPPCHVMYQFYVDNGELSCQMYQRSCDVGLGLPFNIASYALLTHMIAHVTGLRVGRLIMCLGDTHIYENHRDGILEQLQREPRELPQLSFCRAIDDINLITEEDIVLSNYNPHPTLRAAMPMAV